MGISYKKRLKIPTNPEFVSCPLNLYTKEGLHVSRGYTRVVIGGRGPYVEFNNQDIIWDAFYVPEEMEYRADSERVFYEEWRSICPAYVKLYLQKRNVSYADYKIGKCYISPFDLYQNGRVPIIV